MFLVPLVGYGQTSHVVTFKVNTANITVGPNGLFLGGGVIGANILVGHDVAFDLDNNRLGFAESRCDYEGINGEGADPA